MQIQILQFITVTQRVYIQSLLGLNALPNYLIIYLVRCITMISVHISKFNPYHNILSLILILLLCYF